MFKKNFVYILIIIILSILNYEAKSQDTRNQYPSFLSKTYFEVNIGYINYPFSNSSMEAGYTVHKITVPHTAVRLTLLGYRFNKYLSAQITYMRPVDWVIFRNVTGDSENIKHSVWMNVGGLTIKSQLPITKKFSLFAEGGLGLITRHGFRSSKPFTSEIVKNTNYAGYLFGAGFKYHYNDKWDFVLSTTYSPRNLSEKQPYTIFHSLGFTYNMHPLSTERVNDKIKAGYIFPHYLLQIGYSTNLFHYGVNNIFTNGPIPVFWSGEVYVRNGLSIDYQQNIYHTKKVFSLDWGTNASFWESKEKKNNFCTMSLFPLLRFTFLRSKFADYYFDYSVAGPTYISNTNIDNHNTGKNFTFQDFMGVGFYNGVNRRFNAEIKITHYSNGNIFTHNPGITIPLTFNIGYCFS